MHFAQLRVFACYTRIQLTLFTLWPHTPFSSDPHPPHPTVRFTTLVWGGDEVDVCAINGNGASGASGGGLLTLHRP